MVVALQPLTQPVEPPEVRQSGVGSAQRRAQLPQCSAVSMEVSQPFSGSPSQSAKPALQANTQAPSVHALSALARDGHGSQRSPQVESASLGEHPAPHA